MAQPAASVYLRAEGEGSAPIALLHRSVRFLQRPSRGGKTVDYLELTIEFLGLVVAIAVFIITSVQTKKATIEQTQQENTRATLTDFSNLRREH